MPRAIAPLLLALATVIPVFAQSTATPPTTTRYTRLYVFGDSYSDIGAGYVDGNGPTAVAYLGWLMGLHIASSKAPNPAGKSLVFAVSGAGTGEGTGCQATMRVIPQQQCIESWGRSCSRRLRGADPRSDFVRGASQEWGTTPPAGRHSDPTVADGGPFPRCRPDGSRPSGAIASASSSRLELGF